MQKINSDQHVVTCRCGAVISNDEIHYINRCNEEGEEYLDSISDIYRNINLEIKKNIS